MQNNATEYQRLRETLLPGLLHQHRCDPALGEKAFFRGFRTALQKQQTAADGFAENLAEAFQHYLQRFQQDSEAAWKEQLRSSEGTAWTQLYKTCYRPVEAALAHKFQCSAEEAEDIFQEACAVLFKYIKQPDAHIFASVREFLTATAKRIKLNMLKNQPRQHELEKDLMEQQLIEPPVALPALLQPDDLFTQSIQQNLKKLSDDEQTLIRLRHEGHSMDEIAQHFGILGDQEKRRTTARQRLHRAMNKLRENIRRSLPPNDPLLRFLDHKNDQDTDTPQA